MPKGKDDGGSKDGKDHPYTVYFEPEKWAVIERACEQVRRIEGDDDIPTARCLELIAADWLNDPNWHGEAE
jgi:hypothetical protein